jgi:hypothetical protein
VEGRVLASVLAGAEPKAIVEIGTWNGLGSTLCILQGLQGAPYESFHSIECNREKLLAAKQNLEDFAEPRVHLLWGTVLHSDTLHIEAFKEHFADSFARSPQMLQWAEVDLENCLAAPNVLGELPAAIDFLLLDGGEFTTWQEFQLLLPRCVGYIALDDVHTEKCKGAREHLLSMSAAWEEVYYSEGRNGFSIFRRRPLA